MKITEVSASAEAPVSVSAALARNVSESDIPSIERPPNCRKLRREIGPGQKLVFIRG
jgi:hypothetical protein